MKKSKEFLLRRGRLGIYIKDLHGDLLISLCEETFRKNFGLFGLKPGYKTKRIRITIEEVK